jgi:hypothetical protein
MRQKCHDAAPEVEYRQFLRKDLIFTDNTQTEAVVEMVREQYAFP